MADHSNPVNMSPPIPVPVDLPDTRVVYPESLKVLANPSQQLVRILLDNQVAIEITARHYKVFIEAAYEDLQTWGWVE